MSSIAEKAHAGYGELPEGWTRRRLKFDVCLNPKKSSLDMEPHELVSFIPMDAVGEYGGLDLDHVRELQDVYDGYTYFADGDLCIAKITPCFENGKGAFVEGLVNGVGFGTTELHVVRPRSSIDISFLFYISIAHDFRKTGESEMYGAGGQKRIDESFIKNWMAPLPPLGTQRRIARFLDEKTARIDALIEKKQALLERLAEKRQALITRAVTKGLNPDVPMKPSGIDWLGEIAEQEGDCRVVEGGDGMSSIAEKAHAGYGELPEGWTRRRLRFDVCLNPKKSSLDMEPHELVSFIPMDAVGEYGGLDLDHVRELQDVYDGYTYFADGDLCIAKITPCFENGKGAFVEGLVNGVGFGTTELHVVRPRSSIDISFLFYISIAHNFRKIGESEMYGAGGQKRIDESFIKNWMAPLPSLGTQRRIARFLDEKTAQIDTLIEKILDSIRLLEEYRSAQITAAVTGQIPELL